MLIPYDEDDGPSCLVYVTDEDNQTSIEVDDRLMCNECELLFYDTYVSSGTRRYEPSRTGATTNKITKRIVTGPPCGDVPRCDFGNPHNTCPDASGCCQRRPHHREHIITCSQFEVIKEYRLDKPDWTEGISGIDDGFKKAY